ncbi:MAG: transglutaminase family protein [Rhodocyclaceae bacterium]
MLLNIRHQTTCRYDQPVARSIQQLRLTPRVEPSQHAIAWRISAPGRRRQLTDAYGNVSHLLTLDQPHREISIVVEGLVETVDEGAYLLHVDDAVSPLTYLGDTPLTRVDEGIRSFADEHLSSSGRDRFRALVDFVPVVGQRVAFAAGGEEPEQSVTASQALSAGRGGGPDHAHIFIAACRAKGVPARFVSGYFYDGEGATAPLAASHAWADAWVDGLGWVSFDVTRGQLAGREHCRLAVGRDYLDACPVRGVRRGGVAQELHITVEAEPARQ